MTALKLGDASIFAGSAEGSLVPLGTAKDITITMNEAPSTPAEIPQPTETKVDDGHMSRRMVCRMLGLSPKPLKSATVPVCGHKASPFGEQPSNNCQPCWNNYFLQRLGLVTAYRAIDTKLGRKELIAAHGKRAVKMWQRFEGLHTVQEHPEI